jgi:hypothetical protein
MTMMLLLLLLMMMIILECASRVMDASAFASTLGYSWLQSVRDQDQDL